MLENDRYINSDITGHKLKQKPYQFVLPPGQLMLWGDFSEEEDEEEITNDSDGELEQHHDAGDNLLEQSKEKDDDDKFGLINARSRKVKNFKINLLKLTK